MLVGIVVGRQIVQVAVLAKGETEAIVRHIGPALQTILAPPPDAGHDGKNRPRDLSRWAARDVLGRVS